MTHENNKMTVNEFNKYIQSHWDLVELIKYKKENNTFETYQDMEHYLKNHHIKIYDYDVLENGNYIIYLKDKKWFLLLIFFILLCLGLIAGLCFSCSHQQKLDTSYQNGTYFNAELPLNKDGTINYTSLNVEIAGYSDMILDHTNKTFTVMNLPDNPCYMCFEIKEGNETIYTTDFITPSQALDIDLYSLLSTGTHNITIVTNCYAFDTHNALDNAIQTIQITVE